MDPLSQSHSLGSQQQQPPLQPVNQPKVKEKSCPINVITLQNEI